MIKWIGRLFRRKHDGEERRVPASATDYLNRLREDELSVGAALRRGESVTSAPGQTVAAAAKSGPLAKAPPRAPTTSTCHPPVRGVADTGRDFGVSAAIGAATGSTILGYAAGGSFAGALIGAASSDASSDMAGTCGGGE